MADGVKIFLTERKIGDDFYGEQICAHTWEEAEELAEKIGARVVGELDGIGCPRCDHYQRELAVKTGKDWPEEIDLD